jgi:translocation and assembly module TamB
VTQLLDLPGAGSVSLSAKVSGDALAPRLTADVSGRFADLTVGDATLAALLGPAPTFKGAIAATSQDIEIGTFAIDGAGASATAGGRTAIDGSSLRLNVAATLPDVAPVATTLGIAARGQLAGRLQLTRTLERPQLRFAGTAESAGLVVDEATSALLGPTVSASAEGSLGPGGVMLDEARIEGAAAQLAVSGLIGDALALDYRLELLRLEALSPLAGTELEGKLTMAGGVTGPNRSPAVTGILAGDSLRVAGISIAAVEGKMSARDLGERPLGDIALDLVAREQRLSLATSYAVQDDGAVALNDLRLAAPETSLTGNLVLSPTGLVDGRVGGAIGDVSPLGSIFGQRIAGNGTIALTFAPTEQGQAISADLSLRNLSLSLPGSAPLSAEEIGLTADLRDAFRIPAGRAELRIGHAASGALRLTQSTIGIDGNAKALAIRLAAAGEHGRPLAVDAAGELALDDAAQRLRLNSLDASFGTVKARLNAPVELSRDSGGMAMTGLDATVGDGHLSGAGRLGTRDVDLQLSLADLPLEIVSAFAAQVDIGGAASAEFRLAGDVTAPAAHADIRLADLRVGGTRIGETVGVSGAMTLDLREGGGSATAKFGGPPDFALDGQVTAPLAFSLQPFAFELADTAPIAGTIDGRIDLALVPQIVDLQGDQLAGRLALDMTVDGTLAAPRLVGEARIAEGRYATAAAGTVLRDVTAVVTGDNDRIVLRSLTAGDGGEGRLSASGSATIGAAEDARYDGDVSLTRFAIPTGNGATTTASGHVAGNLQLAGTDAEGRRRFVASADASDLVIDGRHGGVFGPHMQASLEGALRGESILIETARVEGADGRFAADGQIAESIDLDYRLELSRLAALSSIAGVELDGSADVAGTVTGPTTSPNVTAALSGRALRIADVVLAGAEGTIRARDLGGSPQGDIDLAVTAQGRRVSLAAPYRLREDGAIALDGLRIGAPQTSLAGDLAMSPAGLLQGRFGGEIGDLALLDPFIDQSVAGAATLDLSFTPAKRTQAVKADVRIRNLSLAPAEGDPLTAEQVTVTANLSDALGTPSGQAEIHIDNAATGELSLTRATVTAEGGKAMQVRLDAAGKHGQPFDVAAAGELALAPAAQRLRLDRLDARFGPIDAKLNGPATLSRDGRTMTLAGLDASIGKGRITGEGNLGRREVALQLALADLPLDILTAFSPQMDLAGTASAELRLAGTPAAPTAHGEVRLKELRSGGTKIGESVALDGTVTFDVQDGRGSMAARFGGPSDFAFDGQVGVPVAFRAQPFALTVAPGAPLSGKVAGQIDLGLIPRIVDLHGDAMAGRLTLDMTVGGTRAEPRLIGDARLADGSYASAEAGTTLRNIEATLTGDNERIVVRSLTATDGGQGRLSASGSANLAGAGAARYDGELTLERFTFVNRIDAVATASGRLRLENATQRSQLAGDVTIDSAELRIPEGLPPNIVKIDVVEVNVPPGRAAARAEPKEESLAPPLGLAVDVNIPGRAFLRGRGLESEWRGKLRVAGTMATPDITGRLEVVRGGLDLLGTQFDVETGAVTFIGGDKIDPELDFVAGAEANDIDARVRVTGFASAPKFEIGSDSGLPPEEALSRLLFGQSAGSLSPGQAVQLAQAAATLSGGGPGVLDKLRNKVGLDVLSLESGGASHSDTRLKAGKYVSDKVFLKVEQGVSAESREVGVEVRVLPRVTVEGGVGHEGSGQVGVNWRYDY